MTASEWAKAFRMVDVAAVALVLVAAGSVALATGHPAVSVALSGAAFAVGAANVGYHLFG